MTDSTTAAGERLFTNRARDAAIRIAIVFLLVLWCFSITKPFLIPVLWGAIIAIGVYPLFRRFKPLVGGRDKLAATLFTLIGLVLVITPTVMLASSAVGEAKGLAKGLSEGTLDVPPPPARVATWPLVGEPLSKAWGLASENLEEAIQQAGPQLRELGVKLLSMAASVGALVLQFVIALVIAGVFLANPGGATRGVELVLARLFGERGEELVKLAGATVSSVFQGVLGVAFIQSVAAGAGLLLAGVPAAGLWALGVLVLAVVQLPPLLILGPVCIYVFSTASTLVAVLFLVWSLLVSFSDALLKPLLLGRGVDVPMLVILIGAIGGMILHGIIGLFVGSVVLALAFALFRAWLEEEEVQPSS